MKARSFATLLALIVLTLGGCSTSTTTDCYQPPLRILVLGQSSKSGTIPLSSVVHSRILISLRANLSGQGYQVHPSHSLIQAFPEYFDRENIRHDPSAVLDLVRTHFGDEIDVVVLASINASSDEKRFHTNLLTSLSARLLDVNSGALINMMAIDSDGKTSVRPNCKGECLEEAIVDSGRSLSLELASAIEQDLGCSSNSITYRNSSDQTHDLSKAYQFILEGFSAAELHHIESSLSAMPGYSGHRVINMGHRHAEYWYETRLGSASINRRVQQGLRHDGYRALVTFSGNTFTIKKITLRNEPAKPKTKAKSTKSTDHYEW